MTETSNGELATLLDEVRRELGETVDELDRTRAAHRRVESVLLVLLDNLPVSVVVLDDDLVVRAASKAAEASWGATVGAHASGLEALDSPGVVETCRTSFEAGHVAPGSVPEGFGAAMVEEPGTGIRYVAAWAG